ncbi:radical SAM family heme chaperone HemW [Imhoffiella purpurea]|uniref:Heme chaperone HemW n=1 Tax=Imhoffiella purpurea TaxID=1249627 RepID=W9W3E5_9GAMM|nr:radical SAM family heme chaperone HemW [Imhoffiella purpurea]EXJ17090.1 Radical SAM family enzyme [Imhoffiella purpurea]
MRPRPAEDIQGPDWPPLTLYIHVPWCLRKCPYCDFNSHAAGRGADFDRYVERLLADLDREIQMLSHPRALASVFIGGGTPSLLSGGQIRRLLDGIRSRMELAQDAEITLEANPGTLDAGHFAAYREAGVDRLSIGVQSLSAVHLQRLGRIHDPLQARRTFAVARASGFDNVNLDMMFALPDQGLAEAAADLDALIDLGPEHISYYQLTLEPDTAFQADPPNLPDPDLSADMAAQGVERLEAAGFARYEVSAYARPGRRCRHNLNYWRFGDYLGIGAGAHGKISCPRLGQWGWSIERREKIADPWFYLKAAPDALVAARRCLTEADCVFEFALNAFRLTQGFRRSLFEERTGLDWSWMRRGIHEAVSHGFLDLSDDRIRPTELGRVFLDDLVSLYVPGDG